MLEEMTDLIATILEEKYKEGGLSIEEILIELDEVRILVNRDEDKELILMFAFSLASNYRCFVEVQAVTEIDEEELENDEDGEEVIIILNERWRSRESIRVVIVTC